MQKHRSTFLAAALLLPLVGCGWTPPPPRSGFSPYGPGYASKPDFARIELDHPLSPKDRAAITPDNLRALPQEKVDQIYARLSAGPIPNGPYTGDLFFSEGGGPQRISQVMGGAKGFANDLALDQIRFLGRVLWKGKVF